MSRPTRRCSTICGCDRSLRGTKEGCAEGDCGACTVLVGRLADGELVYESVNACIRFLGSLDGSHVVTVEHLRGARTARCIRCSRRWSISTARNAASARRASSCRSMRCGCRVAEAVRRRDREGAAGQSLPLHRLRGDHARRRRRSPSYGKAAKDPLAAERKAITARLEALQRRRARRDRRGQAAADRAGDRRRSRRRLRGRARRRRIVAGSTDVGLWVTKFMRDISPVVFIGDLDELQRDFARTTAASRIGAGVTYTEAFAPLSKRIPAARAAVRPHRRRAGAQHGHDRRQHRQRLADRRHAAAADRARRAR